MKGQLFGIILVISIGMAHGFRPSYFLHFNTLEGVGQTEKLGTGTPACIPDYTHLSDQEKVEIMNLNISSIREVKEFNEKIQRNPLAIGLFHEGLRISLKYFKEFQRYNVYDDHCQRFFNCIDHALKNDDDLLLIYCFHGIESTNA